MKRAAIAALLAVALGLGAERAAATTFSVTVDFQAFAPSSLEALPRDVVRWSNDSGRTHTVTSDDGQFDSADLADGANFSHTFPIVGAYPYRCTIHRGMIGEVDIRRVTLDPLPPGVVPTGSSVALAGRTADPSTSVRIEQTTGTGFQAVATVLPRPDGTWSARVAARKTAAFRAASGQDRSETRRLLVIDRTARVRATRGTISVTVVPAAPHARVSLQLLLRNRFGWWPVAQKRLDDRSQTTFHVSGPVRARVALVDRDGWTPLALSRVVGVPRADGPPHGSQPVRSERDQRGTAPKRISTYSAPSPSGGPACKPRRVSSRVVRPRKTRDADRLRPTVIDPGALNGC